MNTKLSDRNNSIRNTQSSCKIINVDCKVETSLSFTHKKTTRNSKCSEMVIRICVPSRRVIFLPNLSMIQPNRE